MRKLVDLNIPESALSQAGSSYKHDSAERHVQGSAPYIDDLPEPANQLHVCTGKSIYAHAKIISLDLSAVRTADGVVDVVCYEDIPGEADISPVFTGDLLMADKLVEYQGQPIFAVAASSYEKAQRAVKLAKVEYEVLQPVLDVEQSMREEFYVLPPQKILRGDIETELEKASHLIESEVSCLGQEHFYLEGQVSAAIPTEEGGVKVISSSQHPSEVQKLVSEVLDVPISLVTAEVRRMGGGFGGKESQAAPLACFCALFAVRTQRPVRYRMSRRDDMVQTGKRHPFLNKYRVGFDSSGLIKALEMDLIGDCGCTADLSDGIVDRGMNHADNAYFIPNAKFTGYRAKTHKVSATAFRGFGGPQGVLGSESVIDDIARRLGKDPLDIRKANLYREGASTTPFGQEIEYELLNDLIEKLEESSQYRKRRQAISEFNAKSSALKKGLALTPVKFGISFTSKHLNQAGALVHIYTDGSIQVNHGGTEMGQGLYIKVAQIVARCLGVKLDRILVTSTRTDKVPNASPTAASAGTDMNGMAALDACEKIKAAMIEFACEHFDCSQEEIEFRDDAVWIKGEAQPFGDFVHLAYMNRVPLWSSGFYKTPKIWYDRAKGEGRPFYYFAHGAACSEVTIDTLTGEYRVDQVDVLHDVGTSINPAIDIGQIEGAFIQGMGWLTTEELKWDKQGQLISNGPANYKIPTAFDVPPVFKVDLYDKPNREETVYRSKAVGEPPLLLPISVWCALRDACSSVADYRFNPPLNPPATTEQVYWAVQAAKKFNQMHSHSNQEA